MLYGLVILVLSKPFFGELGHKPVKPLNATEKKHMLIISAVVVAIGAVIGAVLLGAKVFTFNRLLNGITTIAFIIPLLFFTRLFTNKDIPEKSRVVFKPMGILLAIQVFQAVIWAVTGPATLMYMDQKLNRTFGGFTFAPATFVSVGAAFALVFNPLATYLWTSTAFGKRIRSLSKMSWSYVFGSITLFIYPITLLLAHGGKVNPLWYVLILLIDSFTGAIGGPSGISLMAKMAPKSYDTQIQTAWQQCTTIGNGIGMLIFLVFNTVDKQLALFPWLGYTCALLRKSWRKRSIPLIQRIS
ncbi:POT-type proton-dependent oligopeptide transporter [Schleiferilactobacillus harbinensis]|uniref:POT-type proton-dependent oligopeptide transporter n=1 Tax=Schleiferilactobacillus harbinensis TaxID=304207 RepID=UPI001C994FE9|nr:hypothetical protein [Schleiferilactobacillus harbinensis]